MSYTRPVPFTRISSWTDHTRRNPPSVEAGVDYYCDMNTPIKAAGNGRVVAAAGNIYENTGRYMTIDLDDGRRVRYLHMRSFTKSAGDIVRQGAVIGYSGASGYGSEYFGAPSMDEFPWRDTGGPHVHLTLWPTHAYQFGNNPTRTLDFENFTGGSTAGGEQEDDMAQADIDAINQKLDWLVNAIGAGSAFDGVVADQDTVLAVVRETRGDVNQISNAVGAGGAVDGLIADEDTVLGIVRDLRDEVT